jgi:hypothetical protein
MSGEPVRWRAVRLAIYCALVGVAALVIESRTHLHGTHTVVGIGIKDGERTLLGNVAFVLFVLAALLVVGAVIEPDFLARTASGPAALLAVATIAGCALVFAAYRVQQNALQPKAAGPPPIAQVDCPLKGGVCFNATSQGGTYPAPPSGYDPLLNCTWSNVGPNPARTQEVYQCR